MSAVPLQSEEGVTNCSFGKSFIIWSFKIDRMVIVNLLMSIVLQAFLEVVVVVIRFHLRYCKIENPFEQNTLHRIIFLRNTVN